MVTVNQFPPEFATRNPPLGEVAEVLRLIHISLIRADLRLVSVSTSRHKLIVPLRDVQCLDELQPDWEALWSLCDRYGTTGVYPFAALSTKNENIYAARQFPKRAGYNEDAATGVAACALGAYLTRFLSKKNGWNSFEILQGRSMGRPSRLYAQALYRDGEVRGTQVTGRAEILRHERVRIAR